MTTALDDRIRSALTDAATTTHVDDDALAAIVERAGARAASPWPRPSRLVLAGGIAGGVVVAAVAFAAIDRTSTPPTLAAIGQPQLAPEPAEACGAPTSSREATADEFAAIAHLPAVMPDGYRVTGATARAELRTAPCETAEAAYLDPTSGRLLLATIRPAEDRLLATAPGVEPDPTNECILPEGWLPSRCVTLGESLVWLSDEGTRARLEWYTAGGDLVSVSAYGLTTDELLAAADTITFDGTDVMVRPPVGMALVATASRTPTDDHDVEHLWSWADLVEEATGDVVTISISTDLVAGLPDGPIVEDVGPASIVDLDGVDAIVVTISGPGTGIHGWTAPPGADPMLEQVPEDPDELPSQVLVTWRRDGLSFAVWGSDAATVTEIARQLERA